MLNQNDHRNGIELGFDTQGRSLSISGLVGPAPHDPTATGAAVSVHLPSYFYLSRKAASDDGKFTATRLLFWQICLQSTVYVDLTRL